MADNDWGPGVFHHKLMDDGLEQGVVRRGRNQPNLWLRKLTAPDFGNGRYLEAVSFRPLSLAAFRSRLLIRQTLGREGKHYPDPRLFERFHQEPHKHLDWP